MFTVAALGRWGDGAESGDRDTRHTYRPCCIGNYRYVLRYAKNQDESPLSSISDTLNSNSISSVTSVNKPNSHLPHTKPKYNIVAPPAPIAPPRSVKIGCSHDLGCHADPIVRANKETIAAANSLRWNLAVVWDIRVYILRVCSACRIVLDLSELLLFDLSPGDIDELGSDEMDGFGSFWSSKGENDLPLDPPCPS